jgi:hypothetical protein
MTKIAYVYDAKQNLVRARAEGRLSISELLAYVRGVVEDESIRPGFVEIVDFEPVDDMTISYSELSPLPQIWKKYQEKGVRATILYAPGEVAYGVCNMFQSVIEPEGDPTRGPFTIVRSAEELGARLAELGVTAT